jgi:hypothetical protein
VIDSTIADAVTTLVSNPRPVLFLDTCDFLDVVRSFEEGENTHAAVASHLLKTLNAEPDQVQLIITSLVRHEWGQNVEVSRKRAAAHLRETHERIERILACCEHVKIAATGPVTDFAQLSLVQGLIDLAEELMGRAIHLKQDDSCIERALSRVMEKRRPSHKGEIKDSIHLEHYLEFSRQLSQARYPKPRLFVSGNKADFWDGPPQVHGDLKNEFEAVGLQFFGKLDAALGQLGI